MLNQGNGCLSIDVEIRVILLIWMIVSCQLIKFPLTFKKSVSIVLVFCFKLIISCFYTINYLLGKIKFDIYLRKFL